MKKKSLLALLLAACMCLTLTACGSSSTTTTTTTTTADSSAASDTAADDSAAADDTAAADETEDTDSDLAYVQNKGTLVIGITDFEPMDYQDADGNWIGFDADMAVAFAESLGVTPEFQIIADWDNKVMELEGKTIDVVWNGMTLTDEVKSAMECSNAYFNNAQVVVVPADVADQYQTVEDLEGLLFAVENGSAGMAEIEALGLDYTPVQDQATTLLEVSAGTADAAVIDYLMAAAMVGEGTSYDKLTYTVSLNSEEYGVGFRKGSDLAEMLNEFFSASYADGTMQEIAERYNIADKLIEQ
ncbi:MAG: transporter substrate-binding domain-containing protein [Oscillospiraceae bacterium]|nr:transporter substrate-binding domain-containing protein [Oscillospiraceae bacterium]